MTCKTKRQVRANRKAIVYQQSTSTTPNTDGSFDEEATTYCTRWVKAWPLRGKEQSAMEHQEAMVDWRGEMRYDTTTAAIDSTMWMVLNTGERLNIASVYDPDGRKQRLEFTARQVA